MSCNHNISCNYLKYLLFAALIIFIVFIFMFNNNVNDNYTTIIPYSTTASTGIHLTTNPTGNTAGLALLSFGNGHNSSALIGNANMDTLNFSLIYPPWETAFLMPRDGEITSVFLSYTNGVDANCFNLDTEIIVKVYAAPSDSQIYTELPEATFKLNRILNGMLYNNEIIDGNIKGLSIPVSENTKIMLALYAKSNNPDGINNINLLGGVNGGIAIK